MKRFFIYRYFDNSSRNYTEVLEFSSEYMMFKEMRRKLRLSHAISIRIEIAETKNAFIIRRNYVNELVVDCLYDDVLLYTLPF